MAKILSGLSIVLVVAACKTTKSNSELRVDDGFYVFEAGSFMPGVLPIDTCTATAISDSTLITAAHCLDTSGAGMSSETDGLSLGVPVCVTLPNHAKQKICSDKVYYPAGYDAGMVSGLVDYTYDVAIVVFPAETFKYYHRLSMTPASRGAQVSMVGYSSHNLEVDLFPKRWGANTIVASSPRGPDVRELELGPGYLYENAIITESTYGKRPLPAVSPGDSGGPLLNEDCEVIGVASRMAELESGKLSLHTDLSTAAVTDFLTTVRSRGAYFCEDLNERCSESYLVRKVTVDDPKKFPCRAKAELTDADLDAEVRNLEATARQTFATLATKPFDCSDRYELGARKKVGQSTCVDMTLRLQGDKTKVCPGDLSYEGKILPKVPLKDLSTDLGSYSPVADFVFPDFAQLEKEAALLKPDYYKHLTCGEATPTDCCIETKCRSVLSGTIADEVSCPGDADAVISVIKKNISILPSQNTLQTQPFACDSRLSLSWRLSTGICYTAKSQPKLAGLDLQCFKVENREKKNRIDCPGDLKARLVAVMKLPF